MMSKNVKDALSTFSSEFQLFIQLFPQNISGSIQVEASSKNEPSRRM